MEPMFLKWCCEVLKNVKTTLDEENNVVYQHENLNLKCPIIWAA
jgi:hypothetical protein